jgi:hypothetical protein
LHVARAVITIARMAKRERDLLAIRYFEIKAQLSAITECRVVDGNPADVEAALMEELGLTRSRLSVDSFERQDE